MKRCGSHDRYDKAQAREGIPAGQRLVVDVQASQGLFILVACIETDLGAQEQRLVKDI